MKATRVEGVYSVDPEKNPHAVLYSELSASMPVSGQNLRVIEPDGDCPVHGTRHADPGVQFQESRATSSGP